MPASGCNWPGWKTNNQKEAGNMALRIRKDGRVLCAAMHAEELGDTYLDDGLHYMLSAEKKLLVTEPMKRHKLRGEWWWSGNIPDEVSPEAFYLRPSIEKTQGMLLKIAKMQKALTEIIATSHDEDAVCRARDSLK